MWPHTLCERFTAISPTLLPILLDVAIKGFLLLLLTTAATLIMRRTTAAARHLVWFLGVVSLLVLPILSAGLPGWHILPHMAFAAPSSPSFDTPGEGWGGGYLPSDISNLKSADPHPNPLPEYRARESAALAWPKPISAPSPLHRTWQSLLLLIWLSGTILFLLYIAAEMPAVRFSGAAIAMARPSKLEGRLLAILDGNRNRRSLTSWRVLIATVAALALAVPMACLKASRGELQVAAQPATQPVTQPSPVPPAAIGTWSGDAQIVVNWTQQRRLHATVAIAADGAVTGTVGDARLVDAKFSANRGPLGRALNLATDYIITGQLAGPLIAAEGVQRDSVFIPFNIEGQRLVGGVNSSGGKFGGKDEMALSAAKLMLMRVAAPATQPTTLPVSSSP